MPKSYLHTIKTLQETKFNTDSVTYICSMNSCYQYKHKDVIVLIGLKDYLVELSQVKTMYIYNSGCSK